MKTMMTLTMTLALAVPGFAAKTYNSSNGNQTPSKTVNYNASKSNTGNVTVKNSTTGNQTPSKTVNYNASKSNTGN